MLNTKKHISWLLFLIIALFPLNAVQRITKVGVIDMQVVTKAFIDKSKDYTEYENYKKEFEAKVAASQAKINDWQLQKLEANKNNDNALATKLDNQILNENEFLKEYYSLAKNELKGIIQKISSNDDFYLKLKKAISTVSEEEGYSVVLDISTNMVLYWANDVDITDKVIKAMNKLYETK